MCCEDENTHPKIPASGRNKNSLFMDLCFPVHFINFFVKKEKEREREMLASFPLASLIYLEVLYVNVKLFILFIKFGTFQNNIYFFPLLLIRMVKIYTSFPSSS